MSETRGKPRLMAMAMAVAGGHFGPLDGAFFPSRDIGKPGDVTALTGINAPNWHFMGVQVPKRRIGV
jgi:hypothetical protein